MFYVLNFESHEFISCNNASLAEAKIQNLLAEGLSSDSLEVINGNVEESRLSVQEFRTLCDELNLIDKNIIHTSLLHDVHRNENNTINFRGYQSANDSEYPQYPCDFGNGFKIQTFYGILLPEEWSNVIGDEYDIREDAEEEYPDHEIVVGFRVVCENEKDEVLLKDCDFFCKSVEDAISLYKEKVLPIIAEKLSLCEQIQPANFRATDVHSSMNATNIEWDIDYEEDRALLPTEIEIPAGMEDEEAISDYLSDVAGFCHKGFQIKNDPFHPEDYEYGDFPTLEEIRTDYFKLLEIIKGVKTIEQAKELDGSGKLTVEINGMSIDEFENGLKTISGRSSFRGTNEDIEWIRYEAFGCLSYIYDRFDGSPIFDVWCNAGYTEFITNIRIDDLTEENYSIWVKNEQDRIHPQQLSSLDNIIHSASKRASKSYIHAKAPVKENTLDR